MTHRRILFQSVLVLVLGVYGLLTADDAEAGEQFRDRCLGCWPEYPSCPSEYTLIALCDGYNCATQTPGCSVGVVACPNTAFVRCYNGVS